MLTFQSILYLNILFQITLFMSVLYQSILFQSILCLHLLLRRSSSFLQPALCRDGALFHGGQLHHWSNQNQSVSHQKNKKEIYWSFLQASVWGSSIKSQRHLLSIISIRYTYEVAPVFTLMEDAVLRRMMEMIGWEEGGDGIFNPGTPTSSTLCF